MQLISLFISFIVTMNISFHGELQDFDYAKRVIKEGKVGVARYFKSEEKESAITYLGVITINGKPGYHLVKEFYTIQAAIVKHGHSRIIVFDLNGTVKAQYILGVPEDLPYMLRNNILYFKYKVERKEHIYEQKIDNELPSSICVAPGNCETITNL